MFARSLPARVLALAIVVLPMTATAVIHNISINSNFFSPLKTTVNYTDTVRWTLMSGFHTTTSDVGSPKTWNSGTMSVPGSTFQIVVTFVDGPGPFPYHCSFHSPFMVDTIFVMPAVNSHVNVTSAPSTEQNNAAVSWSETVPGEVRSVWTEYGAPGMLTPSAIFTAVSPASGVPGSWAPMLVPPAGPYTDEWNPSISSSPAGGYMMAGAGRVGAPWVTPNGILMRFSPGAGPFGAGFALAANVPGGTWLDYPYVVFNDFTGTPPPEFGSAHFAWVEYTDMNGDPNGDGNPFNDGGDVFAIWESSTNTMGGPFPFPGFSPPVALAFGLPVMPLSMNSHRPSIDVVGAGGNPFLPPGGAYVAFRDAAAGAINIATSPTPGLGGPWAAPFVAVGGIPPVPAVLAGGVLGGNRVSIATDKGSAACPGMVYLVWDQPNGTDMDTAGVKVYLIERRTIVDDHQTDIRGLSTAFPCVRPELPLTSVAD